MLSLRDPVKRARTIAKDWAGHMVTSGMAFKVGDDELEAVYILTMKRHGFTEDQARAAVMPEAPAEPETFTYKGERPSLRLVQ